MISRMGREIREPIDLCHVVKHLHEGGLRPRRWPDNQEPDGIQPRQERRDSPEHNDEHIVVFEQQVRVEGAQQGA